MTEDQPGTVASALAARTAAVETRVWSHQDWFASLVPSHSNARQIIVLALNQVRKSVARGGDGLTLRDAADANPASFMAALSECARLGLVPGDTFHLVPFYDKGAPGGKAVVGIVDYTGEIELAYRTGEVESIHCEVVREKDPFSWNPSAMRVPYHEIPGDGLATIEERGPLRGVYAYARLSGGGISQPVVMSRDEVAKHREMAKTKTFWGPAHPDEGPWTPAMWRKTCIHELEKWIPTSPEYMRQKLESMAAASDAPADIERAKPAALDTPVAPELPAGDSPPGPTTIASRVEPVDGKAVAEAWGKLGAAFAYAGLGDARAAPQREALAHIMANPDGPPVPADRELTVPEVKTATATLRRIVRTAEREGTDAKTALLAALPAEEQGHG